MATKKAQEAQLKTEIDRAERAKALLGNPLFQESFQLIKEEIFKNWLQTAPTDVESREWFHKLAVSSVKLEKLLRQHITTGTMAAMTIEENRRREAAKRPTRRA